MGAPAPEINSGPWINSAPLTIGGLRGRVSGTLRYRHIGEGAYEATEAMIRRLLAESG